MNFSIELNQAIEWTVRLISVSILIDTFEKFLIWREFRGGGIYSWEWIRQYHGFGQRRAFIRFFAGLIFNFRVWLTLLGLRGAAAFYLLFWSAPGRVYTAGLFILFAVGSLANFRRMPYRPETPNRFTLILTGALFLQSLVPTRNVSVACLWFIAVQSLLSYVTAGAVKLFNREWRRGRGVFIAVNSPNLVAAPYLARFFGRHRTVGRVLTYLTIFIECLFPLVLVAGRPYYLIFLIWGAVFHLSNAVILRLNNYFWPWIATYPAIIYIAQN